MTFLEILRIITFCVGLVFLQININKYFHTLQLTFYNFTEFFPTVKKTGELKFSIGQLGLVIVSVLTVIFNNIFLYIIWLLICFIDIYFYYIFKPKPKKKFVITKRVKITYAIIYIFELITLVMPFFILTYYNNILWAIPFLAISLYKYVAMFFVCLCNAIAKPILKLFNNKYIKSARNIINSNKDMKIIGITGSYGKTSTKNIVTQILSEAFSVVMTPKSFNTTLGVTKSINENIKPYTEIFVCEMGAARLGEIKEICNIVKPDYSVITSIGPQHLTTFKSIENVQKGKFEIIVNSKDDSTAVLNIDNEYIKDGISKFIKNKNVITYSLSSKNANCYVENISMDENGSSFDVIYKGERICLKTKLLGKHNIYNIMCAVCIAKDLNVKNEQIIRAVKNVRPIEHRLELKRMNGVLALDDSFNSNPEGSKMAIECLSMFKDRYKVLVTPGMIELGDKEYELNKKLGEYATSCDYVILVGNKTTAPIEDGLKEKGFKDYIIAKDIYEAFSIINELKLKHSNIVTLFENDLPDSYS